MVGGASEACPGFATASACMADDPVPPAGAAAFAGTRSAATAAARAITELIRNASV